MADATTIRLSDLQIELMQVLWRTGRATTAEVHDVLGTDHELAYTTVATLLKRLEDKGAVRRERVGRQYVYTAAVAESAVRRTMVGGLVDRLFRGDPAALVSHLLGDERVTADDVRRIRRLLDEADAGGDGRPAPQGEQGEP